MALVMAPIMDPKMALLISLLMAQVLPRPWTLPPQFGRSVLGILLSHGFVNPLQDQGEATGRQQKMTFVFFGTISPQDLRMKHECNGKDIAYHNLRPAPPNDMCKQANNDRNEQ